MVVAAVETQAATLKAAITVSSSKSSNPLGTIVQQQLRSLDDTDGFATAWADLLSKSSQEGNISAPVLWGGRGRGGRGIRRTHQPQSIVVEGIHLEYVGVHNQGGAGSISEAKKQTILPSKVLLEGATLKLLPGHVYALVGRNGSGKSTLLRRIQAGKIPGFPPHVTTLYIPQELQLGVTNEASSGSGDQSLSVLQVVQDNFVVFSKGTSTSLHCQMELLEKELEELDDADEEKMEELCEELFELQDAIDHMEKGGREESQSRSDNGLQHRMKESLVLFGIDETLHCQPYIKLSPGQRKKVALSLAALAAAMVSPSHQFLLCLDEPTNHLDVSGLIKLRQFLGEETQRTVLLVSHDTDLLNDVATDVILFAERALSYFPGNYTSFQKSFAQQELHHLRQQVSLDNKRNNTVQTIHHLQGRSAPRRGGSRKKSKMIATQRKKLERQGIEKDDKGHRWTQQRAGTGIKPGALNGIDASTRKDLSTAELLKLAETSVRPPPDKAVQFVFRRHNSLWGEPLIMAMDAGHGYGVDETCSTEPTKTDPLAISKKLGYLFDCVDLCIKEGHTYCLLGSNASGKSTLLRLLAKREEPLEGSIQHAQNVKIGYFGQETMDEILVKACSTSATTTTGLSHLATLFPSKTEKELRGELTNFGLDSKQATTNVLFLSGGERCRLCLAALMLTDPQVLCLDNPTTNLDVESVEALVYGLQRWEGGTIVMVSHDTNMIRALEAECAVLMEDEGKLRRVEGTIDDYLRSFK